MYQTRNRVTVFQCVPIYSSGIPSSVWQKQCWKETCSKGVMDELYGSRNSTILQNSLAFSILTMF